MFRWDKRTWDAGQKDQEEREEQFQADARQQPSKERGIMRQQAKEFLSGKAKWERKVEAQEGWEDFGEAREVETDIELPEAKPRE
jgi:large subunit ribosomal protein L23